MTEMSILRQSPYLLYGRFTLRDNILLGVSEKITDEEIYAELAHFGMDTTIRKLRKGLDTELGYDINLSGGQKQIINFIRTIYQNRKFLIYDEGTNQLDAENELLVMRRLTELKKDRIILFVTHRMSTLKHVDMIYCLEDGTITDSGSPKALIKGKNLFHSFWSAQQMEG
jgi:ABC-type multidrug transport system fused ATPase/permease subunit